MWRGWVEWNKRSGTPHHNLQCGSHLCRRHFCVYSIAYAIIFGEWTTVRTRWVGRFCSAQYPIYMKTPSPFLARKSSQPQSRGKSPAVMDHHRGVASHCAIDRRKSHLYICTKGLPAGAAYGWACCWAGGFFIAISAPLAILMCAVS